MPLLRLLISNIAPRLVSSAMGQEETFPARIALRMGMLKTKSIRGEFYAPVPPLMRMIELGAFSAGNWRL